MNKAETMKRRATQAIALLAVCSSGLVAGGAPRGTNLAVLKVSFRPEHANVSQFETLGLKPAERVLAAQMALARLGLSPGSIDGLMGPKTSAALKAFQSREGLPATGQLDSETLAQLVTAEPATCEYILTAEDFARLRPLEKTWLGKSLQDRLDYETILEMVAERHRSHPNFIMRLNPGIDWTNLTAGVSL